MDIWPNNSAYTLVIRITNDSTNTKRKSSQSYAQTQTFVISIPYTIYQCQATINTFVYVRCTGRLTLTNVLPYLCFCSVRIVSLPSRCIVSACLYTYVCLYWKHNLYHHIFIYLYIYILFIMHNIHTSTHIRRGRTFFRIWINFDEWFNLKSIEIYIRFNYIHCKERLNKFT